MKTPLVILALLSAFVFMGASCRIGKDGASIDPVRPSGNAIVRVTVRKIGITGGQNQATQTPEFVIGYQSATLDVVPTSTNQLYTVPVKANIGVSGEGLGARITEDFEVGAKQTQTNGVIEKLFGK